MEEKKITLSQIQAAVAYAVSNSGMTQIELAKKLGVSQQMVSCYARGVKMPALDMFANLCVVLDEDPAELLCIK